MTKRLTLLLILLLAVMAWAGGSRIWEQRNSLSLSVTTAGDTAQVSLSHTLTAVDSFDYLDSFSYQIDTSKHQTIKFTSALQSMILTPTVDVASTYACSIGFKDDTLGFEKDYASGVATVAALIDTLVDIINNLADLSDSVVAHDSVTYIKIVSKFGLRLFETRWKCEFGITGGAGTIDTASHDSLTTLALVCAGRVAAINADDSVSKYMTASSSGDTGVLITSDDEGVLFYYITLNHADTGGTLVAVQANVTDSWSSITDTFFLSSFIDGDKTFNSMIGKVRISASPTSTQGIGLSDSGYVWLYSEYLGNSNLLAVDTTASLPCSVYYSQPSAAGTDTLFSDKLYIIVRVADTATDTNATITYDVTAQYIMREAP